MVAFNEASTRRVLSPWGAEVKKRLIDRSLKQDDLVSMLRHQGHNVDNGGCGPCDGGGDAAYIKRSQRSGEPGWSLSHG